MGLFRERRRTGSRRQQLGPLRERSRNLPVPIGTSLSAARTVLQNPFPVASVPAPAEDCTTAAIISIDRLMLLFEWVLPGAQGKPACAARLRRPAGGVLEADHVRPGDRSVWPTSSQRTSSTSAALLRWATSLVARGLPRERNGRSSVGMLDSVGAATGDTTRKARSDRPAGRQERQTSAASPRTSQGSIPLAFPSPAAVAMTDEWRGRSSNRGSRRHARCRFSPRSTGASRMRDPGVMPPLVRSGAGRVTGAGVKVPRRLHGEAEMEVAPGPLP